VIPGHLVNIYTQNSQKDIVIVIGAGIYISNVAHKSNIGISGAT